MPVRYRPSYLRHIQVRRCHPDEAHLHGEQRGLGTWKVVLTREGRQFVPDHFRLRLHDVPSFTGVTLGLVAPRAVDESPGRSRVTAWGYNRWGHPDAGGSGAYWTRREAAESCAVEAIDGHAARQRFNAERERRRRRQPVA